MPDIERMQEYSAGGMPYTEWTRETNRGLEVQKWWGPFHKAPKNPPSKTWILYQSSNSPDYTDPGYQLDNR